VILRTGLRAAAEGDMYFSTAAYAAVIFKAAARMKNDLMSELEFLQLLAELGEGSFVPPNLYTTARIPRLYTTVILKT
jgi:hypothetical protein